MKEKKVLNFTNDVDKYSDGEVEKNMLDVFKSEYPDKDIRKILNNNPDWPMLYHLSPTRENLLNWYNFGKNKSLLEVGAGCGALTGLLCDKLKKVVAIELTKQRADIIASRHKDKQNLTIIAGNLNDIDIKEKFDYITLIGVLEYSGKFTHTHDPFKRFLLNAKKNLKKGGSIIIAIENKFGLKYWAGVREDHTGRFFDSIEGYPTQKEIQTFGKKEITDLLNSVGFPDVKFYYPMSDYKLPTEIFSDEYLPTLNHNVRANIFPSDDFSRSREFLFNEKLAMDEIVKNNNFPFFANSFLIFAKE